MSRRKKLAVLVKAKRQTEKQLCAAYPGFTLEQLKAKPNKRACGCCVEDRYLKWLLDNLQSLEDRLRLLSGS